jgi:anaerobic selenocysteine-containing dehydrogenase
VTVSRDEVIALDADTQHPSGGAVCAKGRAAPQIHTNADRLSHPLVRTAPKTAADPAWRRVSWDEALTLIATKLANIRAESGAEAVAFGRGTGAGTGLSPAEPWLVRLATAFGTPNYMTTAHLCSWARDGAALYTLGLAAEPAPDVAHSGTIVLWGANPTANELHLATKIIAARRRGAKLIVVDPRRVGLANKADAVLQLRPGTDGALAMGLIGELVRTGCVDETFVRRWSNGPLLVRTDTRRLLRANELPNDVFAHDVTHVAVTRRGAITGYDAQRRTYDVAADDLALDTHVEVALADGSRVICRTAFGLLADAALSADDASAITGVSASLIRETAELLAIYRPVSHHSYNGIIQHTNATQAARAIESLFVLLGEHDAPGANLAPMPVRTKPFQGAPVAQEVAQRRLGRTERPLGPPATHGHITAYDLYTAILEGLPYRVRGLVSFGGNILMNTGDPLRGRQALERLEFFAQTELFETPASRFADVLLPATSFLENDTLVLTEEAVVERRVRSVAPIDERRSDTEVIFDLAVRLGHAERFAGGDIGAAYDEVLAPAGLSWAGLLETPNGVRVADPPRYRKYAQSRTDGSPAGFDTATGLIELFVDRFAAQGHDPIPTFEEPHESPRRTPALAERYPLVLTNAKLPQYLHSQGRGIPALRRTHPDPTAELHPDTANRYGIAHGEWIVIESQVGAIRVRADVTDSITPGVVCASHGWWEACEELGLPGFDPYSAEGANINLLVRNEMRDPISGAVAHRSTLCRIRPFTGTAATQESRGG